MWRAQLLFRLKKESQVFVKLLRRLGDTSTDTTSARPTQHRLDHIAGDSAITLLASVSLLEQAYGLWSLAERIGVAVITALL